MKKSKDIIDYIKEKVETFFYGTQNPNREIISIHIDD